MVVIEMLVNRFVWRSEYEPAHLADAANYRKEKQLHFKTGTKSS